MGIQRMRPAGGTRALLSILVAWLPVVATSGAGADEITDPGPPWPKYRV